MENRIGDATCHIITYFLWKWIDYTFLFHTKTFFDLLIQPISNGC
nr:MAG TPA: hypothetical protein [Caudoviricetes sp.]